MACHMPTTTYMEVHVRHDHSLRVPRPDLSVDLKTPNACTSCHLDQKKLKDAVKESGSKTDVTQLKQYLNFLQAARAGDKTIGDELARLDKWSADAVVQWYGKEPQKADEPQHFAYALAAARRGDASAEPLLEKVVRNRTWPAIVRATALQEWQQFGSAEMRKQSQESLEDPSPMVRAVAAANLMLAPPEARAKALAPLLNDSEFVVRRAAARSLADVASLLKGDDRNALQATLNQWAQGLMENNDRGGAHLAIGSLQQQLNDMEGAEAAYREALRVEPQLVGVRGNLAAILEAQLHQGQLSDSGRKQLTSEIDKLRAEEFKLLERDARLVPNSAVVQYQYGLGLYLKNDLPAAQAALKKAVELEPNTPDFRLAYALLLQKVGQISAAMDEVEELLKLRPDDLGAQQLLLELKRSR